MDSGDGGKRAVGDAEGERTEADQCEEFDAVVL